MIEAASATINAMIDGTAATLLVVYPHGVREKDLKPTLLVIKDWFIVFNRNTGDIEGKLPSSTASYPVAVILVMGYLHPSSNSPNERVHITGRLSTASAWALNPRENDSCVHIYAKNSALVGGYDSWLLKKKNKSKLSSPNIQVKVEAALNEHRGVLGQGDLA
ncbi:uncharacterized protein LAESUDRAFT_761802 [Laetiporus sulphureus 93-53]|uniref:Uncharacterized protein n=1 Tax=Laetiporus sulphureus 93-53 TaxID=1314785 RepID=A0A165CY07_9APHY|nr:uncharacterized protein LAESUDRAFT_761802 [Laetiporus sulphureus 93-53]KZT03712.1 hypothetical protein LAESUDRAFT_761802 [Laetiporus sulphureus 93-53]